MRFASCLAIAAIGLAADAPGATTVRPFPNRTAIETALNAYEACHGPHNQGCYPPVRYRLTRARCESLGSDPINPGRILCIYWGSLRSGRDAPIRLRHDCAYFQPAGRRGWEVAAYPDADMCE